MGELNRGHNSDIPRSLVRTRCHNGTTVAALSVLIHMLLCTPIVVFIATIVLVVPAAVGLFCNLFLGS